MVISHRKRLEWWDIDPLLTLGLLLLIWSGLGQWQFWHVEVHPALSMLDEAKWRGQRENAEIEPLLNKMPFNNSRGLEMHVFQQYIDEHLEFIVASLT